MDDTTEGTETSFMTTRVGPRETCTGPDCEPGSGDTTEVDLLDVVCSRLEAAQVRDFDGVAALAMDVFIPVLERLRKAVEDAPAVAAWTGACVECGTPIELGDAITWRLRWSPQGPIHKECR